MARTAASACSYDKTRSPSAASASSARPRTIHAPARRLAERNQRDAVRQAQFQFHPRHRPDCSAKRAQHHAGASVLPVPEFIAYAKANPGKISMASAGIGSTPHLAGELFKAMAGVNLVHVPYRIGPQGLTDLLGGQVHVYFGLPSSSIEYVRTGRLRALAVTSAVPLDALPHVPMLSEFVPGYEASTWYGVGAPRNTPTEIIDMLNKEINAGLADTNMKARLVDQGGMLLPGSPADFGKLIAEETEKWGKVIHAANIKAE
jgi:tripartite-type tricarboxylate transporter receptor subunit TctC